MSGCENKILMSTGCVVVRATGGGYRVFLDIADDIDCDGFELMFSQRWYENTREVIKDMKTGGHAYHSIHLDKNIGELISRNEAGDIETALTRFEINLETAAEFGIRLAVLHLWGGVPSDSHIDVNFDLYPQMLETAQKYGVCLTVENLVCGVGCPLSRMEQLSGRFPFAPGFTVDTRQAEFHGQLMETARAPFLWGNGLFRHVHISDYAGGRMQWERLRESLCPGEGGADLAGFFGALKQNGYKGMITLESQGVTDGKADVCKLNRSLGLIKNMLF